jgi:hypothetical protein
MHSASATSRSTDSQSLCAKVATVLPSFAKSRYLASVCESARAATLERAAHRAAVCATAVVAEREDQHLPIDVRVVR